MIRFEVTKPLLGKQITVLVLCFEKEVHISIMGGDRPHIGAVTIGDPSGSCSTTQFPGHKEAVISQEWARTFLQRGFCPVVVEAGIHYDGLSKSGIQAVLDCTKKMQTECLRMLDFK